MKMFTVHFSLLVPLQRAGKPARNEPTTMKLMLLAVDETDATARALAWFEASRAEPTARVMFGDGLRDATAVRLAESYGKRAKPPIWVHEEPDVVVLS